MTAAVERAVDTLPEMTRAHVMAEEDLDEKFWGYY